MNLKFVIAGIGIISVFLLIVYLLIIVVFSIKDRKAAIQVRLPAIDGYGKNVFYKPIFKEPKEFVVEVIEYEEDLRENSSPKNEREFLTALAMESKQYIPLEEISNLRLPEIKEGTHETIE